MSEKEQSLPVEEPLSSLVEQMHATLQQIVRQQNDRIHRLETQLNLVTQENGSEQEESQPIRLASIDDGAGNQDLLPAANQFSGDDFPMIMSIWPDPNEAIQTKTAAISSWHATEVTEYMEPSPLPYMANHKGGLLVHYPEWKNWFRAKFWIPADRRIPLAFDVDHLNQCAFVNEAVSRYKELHDFNERLCNYNGRLLIIDNNTLGENRVCGNLVEKRGWRRGYLSNKYSLYCDNDGNRLNRVIDEPGLKGIPLMSWTTIDGTVTGARPIAPWRRLIIVEGLVGVRPREYIDPMFDYKLSNFWAGGDNLMPGYGLTMKNYLKASGQSFSSSEGYGFQYSWFFSISLEQIYRWSNKMPDIHDAKSSSTDPEEWDGTWIRLLKVGKLYGSSKSMVARDAYFFKMIYTDQKNDDDSENSMNNYWSAAVFRRPSFKTPSSMLPIFHAQLQVLSNSNEALSCIVDDSAEIVDHIGGLLDIGDQVLLDPDRHDELLFDDEAFSRSRTYWWTLNMLTAMQQSLTETLAVRQEIWDTVIEPYMPIDDWSPRAPEILRKDKSLVTELVKLQNRISLQHQRAEALRSGLFNASGVVESRASTRLGEIVKLLTYVSIFYLPLSFSTSLWSTTDQIRSLNTAVLFGVMIALGAVTYVVVLNLNNLSRGVYRQYEAIKQPWIQKMREDSGHVWNTRAERYKGFKVRRFDSSPSEWFLLWYIITWPVRQCLGSKRISTNENHQTEQQTVEAAEQAKANDTSGHDLAGWLQDHPPFPLSEDVPPNIQHSSSDLYSLIKRS